MRYLRGFRGSQAITRDTTALQGVTGSYKSDTRDYRRLPAIKGSNIKFPGVTWCYRMF